MASMISVPFTSREQWLLMRTQDVTASVAGALLGVHPWTTALRLYNLKAGLSNEDDEDSPAMRRGRILEPSAALLLKEDRPNWRIEYPVNRYYRDIDARIGATPDVLVVDEDGRRGIVQIKTVIPYNFKTQWSGEDAEFEPPLWIAVQAIIEAKLTGADFACVAPFVMDRDLRMPLIEVPIHAGIYERIVDEVAEFWARIRDNRPYAPDYKRDAAVIAKMYPTDNGEEIDLSGDNELPAMVDQLISAREAKRAAERLEEEAKAVITFKMQEASFARLADGRRISNKLQKRDVRCKHLEGAFCSQSQFRVQRIAK